jgi:hypothetical protein
LTKRKLHAILKTAFSKHKKAPLDENQVQQSSKRAGQYKRK